VRILIVIYLLLTLSCSNEKYDDTYLKIAQLSYLNLLLNPLRTKSSIEIVDLSSKQSKVATEELLPVGNGSAFEYIDEGKIAIFGGYDLRSRETISDIFIYNMNANTVERKFNLKYSRNFHTATKANDGTFYVIGGRNKSSGNQLDLPVEKFDLSNGTVTQVGQIMNQRRSHRSLLLADGNILIIGGYSENSGNSLSSIEKFNPSTGTSSIVGSLQIPRANFDIYVNGNTVFVFGGFRNIDSKNVVVQEIEKLSLTSFTSQVIASLLKPRTSFSVRILYPKAYFLGGVTEVGDTIYDSEVIDLISNEQANLSGTLLLSHGSCLMNLDQATFMGYGIEKPVTVSSIISDVNLNTGAAKLLFSGLVSRMYPTCVKIKDGMYLIFGGF